jgi:hypothetical protein
MDIKPTTVSEALFFIPTQYKAMPNGEERIFINGDTAFGFGIDTIKKVHINEKTVEFNLQSAVITFWRNTECITITIL